MTDNEMINTIVTCAKIYNENLEKYNIMFVFEDKDEKNNSDKIKFWETIYHPWNFLHLVGIKKDKTSALDFYNNALNGRISIEDIKLKDRFLIEMKLEILKNLMHIDVSAKMIGEYDETIKNKLYTEIVIGTVHYCLGFVKDKSTKIYYVPNSSLREDIRNITYRTHRILAILKKEKTESLYSKISYISKDFNFEGLLKNKNLVSLIDFDKIKYDKIN